MVICNVVVGVDVVVDGFSPVELPSTFTFTTTSTIMVRPTWT